MNDLYFSISCFFPKIMSIQTYYSKQNLVCHFRYTASLLKMFDIMTKIEKMQAFRNDSFGCKFFHYNILINRCPYLPNLPALLSSLLFRRVLSAYIAGYYR